MHMCANSRGYVHQAGVVGHRVLTIRQQVNDVSEAGMAAQAARRTVIGNEPACSLVTLGAQYPY